MNVRYFFVVDKIEKKEVKIMCCPTEEMVADYSSKPPQGSLFRHHRNKIQGVVDDDFILHKEWYEHTLEQHGLWDESESDLMSL